MPVVLGCCPEAERCLLCPPAPRVPPALVGALIDSYRRERAGPDDDVEVRFFGGAPPTDAQLEATGDLPVTVRVRPDLLTRAHAARLARAGVRAVELDALTFHDPALREIGRHHRASLVVEQSEGLATMGLAVGGVLAPGLPRTSHATARDDAHRAASLWSFVRLHPVLVLADAGLRTLHEAGRYEPLTVAEAVTACRDQVEILEPAGVVVTRIGLQPGPDGMGRAVAGPSHPALGQLVASRRTLAALRGRMSEAPVGARVTLVCAPADETRVRGPLNHNVRTLRAEGQLAELSVRTDPSLPRGQHRLEIDPSP